MYGKKRWEKAGISILGLCLKIGHHCFHNRIPIVDTSRSRDQKGTSFLAAQVMVVPSGIMCYAISWNSQWNTPLNYVVNGLAIYSTPAGDNSHGIPHYSWGLCNILNNGPLARYVKLWVTHAPGMLGTFSLAPRFSNPDMHHGTCLTYVPWCIPGSLTIGFLRWENGPGIPGACATRNFTYPVRGPWSNHMLICYSDESPPTQTMLFSLFL